MENAQIQIIMIFLQFADSNLQMEKTHLIGKGSGSTGCLLNGSLKDQKQFISLHLNFEIKDLCLSGSFAICIDAQSKLYVWGTLNETIIQKPMLLQINVMRISCGWNHFLFTTQQGLWGLGNNNSLQLGLNTPAKFVSQPLFLSQSKVISFVCGFRQSYFMTQSQLWGCGESKKYQLGVSQKDPKKWMIVWQNKKLSSKVIQMCCGKRFLLMLTEDGRVLALGSNQQNVFNKMQLIFTTVPLIVFNDIKQIACGWAHSILLDKNQRVLSFGRNNLGQLGRKQTEFVQFGLEETEKIKEVVSGTQFSFAVTTEGRVFGWGWNQHLNISSCGETVMGSPKLIDLPGDCIRLWTYAATTIAQCGPGNKTF